MNSRSGVAALVLALCLGISTTGCTKIPGDALTSGGITYTEADITQLQDELAAQGQLLDRADLVDALGSFGSLVAALEERGVAGPEEVEDLGRQMGPELSKGMQVNLALGEILNQYGSIDPQGAQAIVESLGQGGFAPDSELNPRYGRLVDSFRDPNLADVVQETTDVNLFG